MIGLPSSETSRRSRLSDIFPDILNFKPSISGTPRVSLSRDTPSPDYDPEPEPSLSTISELVTVERTSDEKPVKQTQYYFGDHVLEQKSDSGSTSSDTKGMMHYRIWFDKGVYSGAKIGLSSTVCNSQILENKENQSQASAPLFTSFKPSLLAFYLLLIKHLKQ